ncbi:MAG: hypothetical protein HN576_01375 [Bacteriovoracaceae bacterium]|jgi:hypothetical protein|nr:hypothetical protein [Bacteriovoracaceae bacterium]
MTQITINNEVINAKIESSESINEALDFILADSAREEEVIANVTLNGKDLPLEIDDKVLDEPISNYDTIDFTLKTSLELAYEALDSSNAYIDLIIDKIHALTDLYQENKIEEANLKFGEAIEIIDMFVQLISRIYKTLRKDQAQGFNKADTIQNLEIHLLSILKALVPAKEKEDIIMLCDLLEYELIDNLTQWKIKAVPELKRQKQAI